MLDTCLIDGCKWIGNKNLHAERDADLRKVSADAAVTNDAKTTARQLPSHHDLWFASGVVIRGCARNSPRQIDQKAECEFRHRLHEAGAGARDQHSRRGRSLDVDVADIDRAANECPQL